MKEVFLFPHFSWNDSRVFTHRTKQYFFLSEKDENLGNPPEYKNYFSESTLKGLKKKKSLKQGALVHTQ